VGVCVSVRHAICSISEMRRPFSVKFYSNVLGEKIYVSVKILFKLIFTQRYDVFSDFSAMSRRK